MTTTVNADRYISELDELSAVSSTTMIPVQEESSSPEQSTFFAKISTFVTFFQTVFVSRIRTVVERTSNWTVTSVDSSRVFVLSGSGTGGIQCSISANLPVGFEFEIEDLFGKTITFVPVSSAERIKTEVSGQNYVLTSSEMKNLRIRKVSSTRWNVS